MNNIKSFGFKLSTLSRAMLSAQVLILTAGSTVGAIESHAADSGRQLEEVVVTAQKREQSLQDVGLTVNAIGAEALEKKRIENVADLALAVPGLQFAPSPNATPVYTVRGVGFYESSIAAYPDVASYIDQAPLVVPAMTTLTAFDLERVEVLKGPQGTLFGNNATGGAINFIAAKPTDEFSAGFNVGYARFDTFDQSGFVSGPISDTLRGRVAVKHVRGDDWQSSYTRDDTLGETNEMAGRALLEWDVSEDLVVNININGWRDKSDPQAPQAYQDGSSVLTVDTVANTPFNQAAADALGLVRSQSPFIGYPASPKDARSADWTGAVASPGVGNFRPYADNKFSQGVVRIDYDITPDISLTSITSYSDYSHENGTDGDGTALVGLDIYKDTGDVESFSQELRLAGVAMDSRMRWVVGANYEDTTADEVIELSYYDASSGWGGSFQGFTRNRYSSFQDMENMAVFGNVEFEVIENLTIKAGVRYTEAERTAENGNFAVPGYVEPLGEPGINAFFNGTWPALSGLQANCSNGPGNAFVPFGDGDSFTLDTSTCQVGTFKGTLDEDNTSWSIGLDYKITEDVLVYANVAKGYKAGSYPTVSAATWNQFVPVVQEELLSYEVGLKASIPDLYMTINAAAFYYDYKDKQLRAKIVDPIFGFLDALANVPESKIKGAEIEVTIQPIEGLNISFAATYLDTEITDFIGVDPTALVGGFGSYQPQDLDFSGAELPFSPEWQLAASLDYTFPVSDTWDFVIGGNLSGQASSISGIYAADDKASQKTYELEERFLLDLYVALESSNGWKVTAWGKNVTDEYYWTSANFVFDNNVRYAGRPAEYGISVGYSF